MRRSIPPGDFFSDRLVVVLFSLALHVRHSSHQIFQEVELLLQLNTLFSADTRPQHHIKTSGSHSQYQIWKKGVRVSFFGLLDRNKPRNQKKINDLLNLTGAHRCDVVIVFAFLEWVT